MKACAACRTRPSGDARYLRAIADAICKVHIWPSLPHSPSHSCKCGRRIQICNVAYASAASKAPQKPATGAPQDPATTRAAQMHAADRPQCFISEFFCHDRRQTRQFVQICTGPPAAHRCQSAPSTGSRAQNITLPPVYTRTSAARAAASPFLQCISGPIVCIGGRFAASPAPTYVQIRTGRGGPSRPSPPS